MEIKTFVLYIFLAIIFFGINITATYYFVCGSVTLNSFGYYKHLMSNVSNEDCTKWLCSETSGCTMCSEKDLARFKWKFYLIAVDFDFYIWWFCACMSIQMNMYSMALLGVFVYNRVCRKQFNAIRWTAIYSFSLILLIIAMFAGYTIWSINMDNSSVYLVRELVMIAIFMIIWIGITISICVINCNNLNYLKKKSKIIYKQVPTRI